MSLRAMAEHMQATPLQMTMDAGDAAAEPIDAGDAAAQSRCAAAPIDAGDAAAPLPSATEIVEVTSGAMPATRDVDLMTVWHFRYWNIKPYRAEGVLHLRDDGQVRLTTPDSDSYFHGSWINVNAGEMFITFHYVGMATDFRRHCLFYQPRDSGIWLCENPYPVAMQFSHTSQVARPPARVPFGQQPPPPPPPFGRTGAEAAGDVDPNWYDVVLEQRLRWEMGVPEHW